MIPDYYGLLGVPPGADDKTIRDAYRALAKSLHPDLAEYASPRASERFSRITAAYNVLRHAEARALYDRERAQELLEKEQRQQQLKRNLQLARQATRRARSPDWEIPMGTPRSAGVRSHHDGHRSEGRLRSRWHRSALAFIVPMALAGFVLVEGAEWSFTFGDAPPTAASGRSGTVREASVLNANVTASRRRVDCKAPDGTAFTVVSDGNGDISNVVVDGTRLVVSTSERQGDLLVIGGTTGSGRKVAIGLFVGDTDGTTFTPYDAAGRPEKTSGATCAGPTPRQSTDNRMAH